jgi:polyhydroxyalkanoate synthesis repressor PhaR
LLFYNDGNSFLSMSEKREPSSKKLELKKYPNRRYYDSTHSRHLTLDQIRSLVQEGYDLQVTDARSSSDITAQVLTQIILEMDTQKLHSLSVPLLVRLIRMDDQAANEFIEKYVNPAVKDLSEPPPQVKQSDRKTPDLPLKTPPAAATPAKAPASPATEAKTAPEPLSEDFRELLKAFKGEQLEFLEPIPESKRAGGKRK